MEGDGGGEVEEEKIAARVYRTDELFSTQAGAGSSLAWLTLSPWAGVQPVKGTKLEPKRKKDLLPWDAALPGDTTWSGSCGASERRVCRVIGWSNRVALSVIRCSVRPKARTV